MNIDGLSEATIEKFVERGFIQNYTDLYTLEQYKGEIISMEGFGELSYNRIINSIEKSKNAQLPNFIYALGINNVGLVNARLISAYFDYDVEKIVNAREDELLVIDGVGEVIAQSVVRYFGNDKNVELMKKAMGFLKIEKPLVTEESSLKFSGMTFVITGDVHIFKNRKEVQQKIEQLGGKATGSVSSKTNYLINNDINSSSSKNKKAKELGIPIITEEQFIEMIEKN
jgi:DNA ligase (NAD+)